MFAQLLGFTLLALTQRALAHGGVLAISNGGNWYDGWQPYDTPVGQSSIIRPWSSYNPILNATDPTIGCNDDGTSPPLQLTANVVAGSEITAYWNQPWPHPYGPMLVYLAECPGTTCTGVNSNTLDWFKIDEAGLLSGTVFNGSWGAGEMIADNSSWTTTIPKTVPSGNYLIRFETIALHSLPAQFYPECAQLSITGGGSLAPTAAELVTFPGAYSNSDPGLTVDIYSNAAQTMTTYPIPGPPLYGSTSSSSTVSSPSGTSTGTSASTGSTGSSSATSASASSSPTTSAPGTVQEYGQCGGQGWTGATGCVSPFVCTALNSYYSQCLSA